MCKVPGVQGPMDDAFMAPFLVVTPDDATARERPALPCSVQHGFKTNESPVSGLVPLERKAATNPVFNSETYQV